MKQDNKKKKYFEIIGYAAVIYLAYIFFIHGLEAIKLNPSYISLAMVLGVSYSLAKIGVILVGVIDLLIVIALFFYRKKYIIIYAGIWPVVPVILNFVSSGYLAWLELLFPPLAAIIAYWILYFEKVKT